MEASVAARPRAQERDARSPQARLVLVRVPGGDPGDLRLAGRPEVVAIDVATAAAEVRPVLSQRVAAAAVCSDEATTAIAPEVDVERLDGGADRQRVVDAVDAVDQLPLAARGIGRVSEQVTAQGVDLRSRWHCGDDRVRCGRLFGNERER
jgi:hypothetical protein